MSENFILDLLGDIRGAIWDEDIPSPTVPEYREHHESIQRLLNTVDEKMEQYRGMSNQEIVNWLIKEWC